MKPEMTLTDAIKLIIERNGGPHEDDWDLCEAATVLAMHISQTDAGPVGSAGRAAFAELGVDVDCETVLIDAATNG